MLLALANPLAVTFVVPRCAHADPVIKTLYHICPGEKDAPSCAKEAYEGPPSSG